MQDRLLETRRRRESQYYTLLVEGKRDTNEKSREVFKNYTRMSPEVFMEVLDRIRPAIEKKD